MSVIHSKFDRIINVESIKCSDTPELRPNLACYSFIYTYIYTFIHISIKKSTINLGLASNISMRKPTSFNILNFVDKITINGPIYLFIKHYVKRKIFGRFVNL